MAKKIFFLIILMLFSLSGNVFAQDNAKAILEADTNNFSINKQDGWILYNSYLNRFTIDSVDFEIIIQHDNTIDWKEEHFVGKIKNDSLKPLISKILTVNLLDNVYTLRIDPTGECFLQFFSGILPTSDPVVMGIIVHYRL